MDLEYAANKIEASEPAEVPVVIENGPTVHAAFDLSQLKVTEVRGETGFADIGCVTLRWTPGGAIIRSARRLDAVSGPGSSLAGKGKK